VFAVALVIVLAVACRWPAGLAPDQPPRLPAPYATTQPPRAPGARVITPPPASLYPVFAPGAGLSAKTAFASVTRWRRTTRLDTAQTSMVLDTVWRLIGNLGDLSSEPNGPRFLANLRLNESLLNVTLWTPQPLVIGLRRVPDVSGLIIPFSGPWRNRVLVVQEGAVEASPSLLESDDLAALRRVVESAGAGP
jgi:hypothetical protein